MKKTLLLMTLLIVTAAQQGRADTALQKANRGLVFGATAALGAAIAGPAGLVAGAFGGALLAESDASRDRSTEQELVELRERSNGLAQDLVLAEQRALQLEQQLAASSEQLERVQSLASSYLNFQVLFRTGSSELDDGNRQRLQHLADHLAQQNDVQVILAGHADPRGDEVYNQELSRGRVEMVSELLQEGGVSAQRITSAAYGDQHSRAAEGDLDAYALERRVVIELMLGDEGADIAQAQ